MLLQKIFKIRIFNLAENEFQTTKFLDFWNSVANSLTFRGLFQISWLFQVFQVSGNLLQAKKYPEIGLVTSMKYDRNDT